MSANQIGQRFQVTSFGESHGVALGVVIDGCPAGVVFDESLLRHELERRRPGVRTENSQQQVVSARSEGDVPEILSGVFEGKTLGTPIAIITRNQDQRSQDYAEIKNSPRAGHADDVWKEKFGHSDHRGGGRSSGRETVSRVMAGAVAKMLLNSLTPSMKVMAYTSSVGSFALTPEDRANLHNIHPDDFEARFPSTQHLQVRDLLKQTQASGDSLGGWAELWIRGVPSGLGQPVFHKLKSDLAMALMSIGAVNGVELGEGFDSSAKSGVEFHRGSEEVYGGIRGGISTGQDILLRISFKPTSSILNVAKQGRHDPFIVTRAVPVIEAMANIVLADHCLWQRSDRV